MSHLSNISFRIHDRSFWTSVILLILQQIIVASSTIWITRFIATIQNESPSLNWLYLYFFSLVLPYFPGAMALIYVKKSQIQTSIRYVNQFALTYPNKLVEWTNRHVHSSKSSILSNEAPNTLQEYLDYAYHLASTGLNVTLNLVVLAIVIDPLLLCTYALGIFLTALILFVQKKVKKRLSYKAQRSRIDWTSLLLKAWDNILLNNSYNLNLWLRKSTQKSKSLLTRNLGLAKFSQSISIAMALALITPSIFLISILAILRINDLIWLAMLAVTLPRLFQILNYSYELLLLIADIPMQENKINTVVALLSDDRAFLKEDKNLLSSRIHWAKIHTSLKNSSDNVSSIPTNSLLETFPPVGRVTLSGENGSGKSSLMLLIKQKYGVEAFYLPARHELLFRNSHMKLSTGQLSSKILNEISCNLDAKIILLDEWDANLDKKNVEKLSSLIDKLSTKYCVVESRHIRGN